MLFRSLICIFLLASVCSLKLSAQSVDSLAPEPNRLLTLGEGQKTSDPSRAALLSAAFPGLGQIYNRKYWKLPIIYGGAYALGYGIHWNDDNYNQVRNALFAVRSGTIDPDNPLHTISETILARETDRFRRDRDFLIIGSIMAYLIVIVDSYVDAHLRDFPLGKDTALQMEPMLRQDFGQVSSGLVLSLNF